MPALDAGIRSSQCDHNQLTVGIVLYVIQDGSSEEQIIIGSVDVAHVCLTNLWSRIQEQLVFLKSSEIL